MSPGILWDIQKLHKNHFLDICEVTTKIIYSLLTLQACEAVNDWMTEVIPSRSEYFFISITSRLTLSPTQLLSSVFLVLLPYCMNLSTHVHLVPRLKCSWFPSFSPETVWIDRPQLLRSIFFYQYCKRKKMKVNEWNM
jgi:hypothetical protein